MHILYLIDDSGAVLSGPIASGGRPWILRGGGPRLPHSQGDAPGSLVSIIIFLGAAIIGWGGSVAALTTCSLIRGFIKQITAPAMAELGEDGHPRTLGE